MRATVDIEVISSASIRRQSHHRARFQPKADAILAGIRALTAALDSFGKP